MDYTKRSEHQLRIDEMMAKASQELPTVPTMPSPEARMLRAKICTEENLEMTIDGLAVQPYVRMSLEELKSKGDIVIDGDDVLIPVNKHRIDFRHEGQPNLKEIVDGCGDGSVVIIGTLSACGVNDHSVLMTIDENNLEKFGPGGYKREDGKWIKPPNHQPPDIDGVLKEQQLAAEVRKAMTKEQRLASVQSSFLDAKRDLYKTYREEYERIQNLEE